MEGVIKFNCCWKKSKISIPFVHSLNVWRNRLFDLKLIGTKNNIGYGNLSIRYKGNRFAITGSQTGHLKKLKSRHYSIVNKFDIKNNLVYCKGLTKASSESMTHAMIYKLDLGVNSVIHVHSLNLWKKLLHKLPTTSEHAKYGTTELAEEIERVFDTKIKLIIMAGHRGGIMVFGSSIDEAGETMLYYRKKYKPS